MKLFNTRLQQLEPFYVERDPVTLYVCGITPYDTTHLGHAFTYAVADVLVRYLEFQGRKVKYVQNVTDIDDDILRKAREVGEDWRTLGNRWTTHFIQDMQALNIRPPDHYPRATETIPQMIEMVEALIYAGLAYCVGGNVYFAVESWPHYGKLSRLPRRDMLAISHERGNDPTDPNKRNPLDFVLWQAQTPGEPAWPSPWGAGRPGWHIECSAMSTYFLGETIDIHSGGEDLVFPHHECEIAQVEPVTQRRPFVRYWLHTAMVRRDGEKMSKSLGNLVMVRDLFARYTSDALRLYLALHHYRTAWAYREAGLRQAANQAQMLQAAVGAVGGTGAELDPTPIQHTVVQALGDDLNTPKALNALTNLAEQILYGAGHRQRVQRAQRALRDLAGILGLRLDAEAPEPHVCLGWQTHLRKFSEDVEVPCLQDSWQPLYAGALEKA
jgi:L-cysteine:1D-myo-inositol 2-amino-2-deoxy-alpha-D-glucopyranoside ligase